MNTAAVIIGLAKALRESRPAYPPKESDAYEKLAAFQWMQCATHIAAALSQHVPAFDRDAFLRELGIAVLSVTRLN